METVEALYVSERPALVALAWMLTGSREEAEDVVHDAFARLDARGLDGIDNPAAYVRTAVHNGCTSALRRRTRSVPTDAPPTVAHLDQATLELAGSLARLSPRRRLAIVLRYYDDLPVHEIAEIMGSRPSTVSSLIHRALRDLQGVLDER